MVQYSGARQVLINIDLQKETTLCLKMHGEVTIQGYDPATIRCMEEMKTHAAAINAELDMQKGKSGGNMMLLMPVS